MVAIFVVVTVLLLLGLDALLRHPEPRTEAAPRPLRAVGESLRLPSGLFVGSGHTWACLLPTGTVRTGVDELVVDALAPCKLQLRQPGEHVRQGEPMLAVAGDAHPSLNLPAPLSGVIEAVNDALLANRPGVLASPYDAWVYCLRPSQLADELGGLRVGDRARQWLVSEVDRFCGRVKAWGSRQPIPSLADGGSPVVGVVNQLDDQAWRDFEREFLTAAPCTEPGGHS